MWLGCILTVFTPPFCDPESIFPAPFLVSWNTPYNFLCRFFPLSAPTRFPDTLWSPPPSYLFQTTFPLPQLK